MPSDRNEGGPAALLESDHVSMTGVAWRETFLKGARVYRTHRSLASVYLPWLRQTALQVFAKRGQTHHRFEEYLQWAWVGLFDAARRFDPTAGTDFRGLCHPVRLWSHSRWAGQPGPSLMRKWPISAG